MDPERVIAPTSDVTAAATAICPVEFPNSFISMNEEAATKTEAQPPKPLNRATSSGIDVI